MNSESPNVAYDVIADVRQWQGIVFIGEDGKMFVRIPGGRVVSADSMLGYYQGKEVKVTMEIVVKK